MTPTMYERVGGREFFETLTRAFYENLEAEPVLRGMYPDDPDEFAAAEARLCGFLVQYWGGPADYSAERGHPRLRMRHFPFPIGQHERDVWYRAMEDAVRAVGVAPEVAAELLTYFAMAATAMINRDPLST